MLVKCLHARELDAAHVLTEEQTRAVRFVAGTARAKSEAAHEGLQRQARVAGRHSVNVASGKEL